MTSRERIESICNHREPDRLGADQQNPTILTAMDHMTQKKNPAFDHGAVQKRKGRKNSRFSGLRFAVYPAI